MDALRDQRGVPWLDALAGDVVFGWRQLNRLLVQAESRATHPLTIWAQIADHLRQTPGVQSVAVAGWAPLTGNRWRSAVQVEGRPSEANAPYFLSVSPGFFDTMRIGTIGGRDFTSADTPPRLDERKEPMAGVGIVNEAFARTYFDGQSPVGRRVSVRQQNGRHASMQIVGLVRDAVYDSVREPVRPTVYVPLEPRNNASLMVRAAGEPRTLAPVVRAEASRARPDVRVRAVEPHAAFVRQQMIRERLLATLSLFFALVALLLAAIGLYGVLNYAVIRQRREIGIRMALGARAPHIVGRVTALMFAVVGAGALAGLTGGVAFGRVVQSLVFQVTATDPAALAAPFLVLAGAALLATLAPAVRAVRIDPAQTLRTE